MLRHLLIRDNIETALEVIKEEFKPGDDIIAELAKLGEQKPELFVPKIITWALIAKKDPKFIRDAHHIPSTNLVAAAGTQCNELENLLKDTLLNAQFPIHHVIALGFGRYCYPNPNFEKPPAPRDEANEFINYASVYLEKPTPKQGEIAKAQAIAVKSETIQLNSKDNKFTEVQIRASELGSPHKILTVYNFGITDNSQFSTLFATDKLSNKLWELFVLSLKENVLIHCHAGLGRTGHLIYLFEILKLFVNNTNEQNKNPELLAKQCKAVLENMRSVRAALILNESQLTEAVRGAASILNFAIENKLVTQEIISLCEKLKTPFDFPTRTAKSSPFSPRTALMIASGFTLFTLYAAKDFILPPGPPRP